MSGPQPFKAALPWVKREQGCTCGRLLGLLDMLPLSPRPSTSARGMSRFAPEQRQSPCFEPGASPTRIVAFRAVPTLQSPSRKREGGRWTRQCTWLLLSPWRRDSRALFPPTGPSALSLLAVLPLHPVHVEHCRHFCFTIPRDCSAPILQPSRTETLIKLFENPIKMLYECVCHWQRFREEN